MFILTDLSRPFLLWVSVELEAQANMCLKAQRLRAGNWIPRRFVMENRVLRVKTGQSFIIRARKSEGFRVGERVTLDRVADRRPINRRWETVATL